MPQCTWRWRVQMCERLSFSWLSPHHPMTRWFKRRPRKSTLSSPLQPPAGPPAPPQVPHRLILWPPPLSHSQQGKDPLVSEPKLFLQTVVFKVSVYLNMFFIHVSFQVKSRKNHRGHHCQNQRRKNRLLKHHQMRKLRQILQHPQTLSTNMSPRQM